MRRFYRLQSFLVLVMTLLCFVSFDARANDKYYIDLIDRYRVQMETDNTALVLTDKSYHYYNNLQQLVYNIEKGGNATLGYKNGYCSYYEYNADGSLKYKNYDRWYLSGIDQNLGYWQKQTREEYYYLPDGKIEKMDKRKYNFNSGSFSYTSYISYQTLYNYDENGKIKEVSNYETYYDYQPIKLKEVFKYLDYNDYGLVGKIERWGYKLTDDENMVLTRVTLFEYNNDGTVSKKTEQSDYDPNTKISDVVFTYNAIGNIVSETTIEKPWGVNEFRETTQKRYTYDESNNLLKVETFNRNSNNTGWLATAASCDSYHYSSEGHLAGYAPQNLQIVNNGSNFNLSWTAPTLGAKLGYNIYVNGNKVNDKLVNSTSYAYESSYDEDVFCFVTQVYNESGSESDISNVVLKSRSSCNSGATNVQSEISKIVDPSTKDEKVSVKMTWSAPANNSGLLGYDLYLNDVKKNNMRIEQTNYSFDIFSSGAYTVKVYAIYSNNCLPLPAENSFDVVLKKHNTPSNFTVTQIPGLLAYRLEWTHSTDFEEQFLGFCLKKDNVEIFPVSNPKSDRVYVDINVTPNKQHQYNVGAVFSDLSNPLWSTKYSPAITGAVAGLVQPVANNDSFGTVEGGGDVVAVGTSVELIATPAVGYVFKNWSVGGAVVSVDNIYNHIVTPGNQKVLATFAVAKTEYCVDEIVEYAIPWSQSNMELYGMYKNFYDSNLNLIYKVLNVKKEGDAYSPYEMLSYEYNDNEDVKVEVQSSYNSESDVWTDKTKTYYTYSELGKLELKRVDYYNLDGVVYIVEEFTYSYDPNSGLLSKISLRDSYQSAPFQLKNEERYVAYDEQNRPTKIENWVAEYGTSNMNKVTEKILEYNDEGRLSKKTEYVRNYETGELEVEAIYDYTYRDNGQILLEMKNGKLWPSNDIVELQKSEYIYDDNDHLITNAVYSKNGDAWKDFAKYEYIGSSYRHNQSFVPNKLTVVNNEGMNVSLSWESAIINQDLGYNVYKNTFKINDEPIVGNSYVCENTVYGDDFYFVTQILDSGDDSDVSNRAIVYKPDCSVKANVTDCMVNVVVDSYNFNNEKAEVTLDWTIPEEDMSSVYGFNVYANGVKKNGLPIPVGQNTYMFVIDLSGLYAFNVSALCKDECRPIMSDDVTRDIVLKKHLAPIVSASQIADRLAVQISWTHATDFEDNLEGYYIMRNGVEISDKELLIHDNTFVDIFPDEGEQYQYSVAAVFSDISSPVRGESSYLKIADGIKMGIVNVSISDSNIASVSGGGLFDVDQTAELRVESTTTVPIYVEWMIDDKIVYEGAMTYNYRVKNQVTNVMAKVRLVGVKMIDDDFRIYPNPVKDGVVYVEATCKKINLVDIAGKIVKTHDVIDMTEGVVSKISIDGVLPGVYLLQIVEMDGSIHTSKLIVE